MKEIENNLSYIQQLAKEYTEKGKPLDWFEVLYQKGKDGEAEIPWADRAPNPNVKNWFDINELGGEGKTALVIGCGLGEDAEYLASLGFQTDAFDISPTAIQWSKEIWKDSKVNYFTADLFDLPAKEYDFVLEIYTIQTMPKEMRAAALSVLPKLVAHGGYLLLICRGREEMEDCNEVPYPLTLSELSLLENELHVGNLEDYIEKDMRRFRILYYKAYLV